MSNKYTITIKDQFNKDKRFLLFNDAPKVWPTGSGDMFTNVYMISPPIQSGNDSSAEFLINTQFFALYGTEPGEQPGGRARIYTQSFVPVTLSSADAAGSVVVVLTVDGESPKWDKDAATGSFHIGIGTSDHEDLNNVIPITAAAAQPNTQYTIQPSIKCFITTDKEQPGTTISSVSYGKVLQVDITKCTHSKAIFILNADGNYGPDDSVGLNHISWEVHDVEQGTHAVAKP